MSDGFNSIDNALDRQNAGICDLGYTNLALNNQTNTNILTNANMLNNGIKDVQYAIQSSQASVQNQLQNCCCENEKQIMQTNYNMATQNCATLQAIDKVGDRIIDYLANDKNQTLRDENFALKLASSQANQNAYIQNLVRPQINPCYVTTNPYCSCGNAYQYYGTTIS